MNKRITSLLLCFVMIFAMLATAVPTYAISTDSCVYTIEADKTTAHPGDTVEFTVYMQQKGNMLGLEGELVIPAGLTFVADSGKLTDGIKTTLGWDDVEWDQSVMMLTGSGSEEYTGEGKLALMKFECTVDSDAELKEYTVKLKDYLAANETGDPKEVSLTPATVSITAAPVPATGIALNKSTLTLVAGNSETLTATVEPSDSTDTVTWTSDTTTVATVDKNGKVTAVAPGTSTITAKAGEKTATCNVTVEASPCTHTNKKTVSAQASTCTVQGWSEYQECSDCGKKLDMSGNVIDEKPYLPLAAHAYTAKVKSADYVIRPGNCAFVAQYYYSCSVCGKSEKNLSHFFEGEKNKDSHTNGTRIEGAVEPDHKNQIPGSTGKTICNGCGAVLIDATEIQPGAHVAADVWSSDETYHWKECSVVGCGVQIDGTKAAHSSTDKNVATCQKKAVCDVCGTSYGDLADHSKATEYTSDETGHWYTCTTPGCTEKLEFAEHTPDHEGHATEEYPIKCTECKYVMETQLAHTHKYTQRNTDVKYKATDATCTKAATYYYSCTCGEKGTDTFESGRANGHTEGTEWKNDATNHWHICTVKGCEAVIEDSKAEHTPDHEGGATEEYPIKCSECQYVMEAQLAHTHKYTQRNTDEKYKDANATCTKAATYFYSCTCGEKGTDTFELGNSLGHSEGTAWEKDKNYHWHICTVAGCGVVIESSKAEHTPDHEGGATYDYPILCSECGYVMEAQLEDGDVRIEVPFKLTVAKTGEKDPSAEAFKFALSDFGAPVEIKIVTETVATDGAKTYDGSFVFTVKESKLGNLSEGFVLSQVKGSTDGWTYDETAYRVVPILEDGVFTGVRFFDVDADADDNGSETVLFTNSYNAKAETPKPDPETSPKTGDNSMLTLWVALLFVSGAALTGTTLYSRKKRTYNR